eukprot:TRINITY_DN9372_c0_g1_i2.p1 TRINITY_DN9372_c0_g1~~TRINITY_DN9372_c0_g1_i2.p1  ORF type:complete len:1362 (-),score=400.66 TRINITY_DN9372_c0_g1_i2:63-4148(-)
MVSLHAVCAAVLLVCCTRLCEAQGTYEDVLEKYGPFDNIGEGKMGILELRNGYFYDPLLEEYVWPHGMAYQTWNKAIFQYQTLEQIDYDLREMKRMHVNSVRVEFTYPDSEDELYEFDKLDFLVNTAATYRLRLWVVIGHQYLPKSITKKNPDLLALHYDGINDIFNRSTILNYNNPDARSVYQRFISLVLRRYRDAPSVGAWVIGNELAMYDLWEDLTKTKVHRFVGYDEEYSLPSYRSFLRDRYQDDIGALNRAWNTAYSSFAVVPMALSFPPDREDQSFIQKSGYHDLLQWRKTAIAEFVAVGALTAQEHDPNHLITFAQLGGIFDGNDANTNCEDGPTIVARCAAAGKPLDFYTINNYPWVVTGTELRSADFGISKFRDWLGIPILVSETGMSDTDILLPETAARMARANPSLVWEAAMGGAVGVHIFHWSDRDFYLSFPFPFEREAGFGMVYENRTMKQVWWNVLDYYRRMDEIDLPRLLVGSKDPSKDVAVLWGEAVDLGYNRANQEIAMIWGAFKRMGLQPRMMDDQQFRDELFFAERSVQAVYLPRSFQMTDHTFDQLYDIVRGGLHLHASSDLPGRFTEYHAPQPKWERAMDELFGLNVSMAVPGFDSGVFKQNWTDTYKQMLFYDERGDDPQPPFRDVWVWKMWREVATTHARTLFTHRAVLNDTLPVQPALVVATPNVRGGAGPLGKTAVHLHSVGDVLGNDIWNDRRHLMESVYVEHFGMRGHMKLSGNGSQLVVQDWRECENGSILLFFMNLARYPANFTVEAPEFLHGNLFVLEDLTRGRMVPVTYPAASFRLTMDGDESVLLYSYASASSNLPEVSIVNPAPVKLWISDAPRRMWPNGHSSMVSVQYHSDRTVQIGVQLQVWEEATEEWSTIAESALSQRVAGAGQVRVGLTAPFLHDMLGSDAPRYVSAQEGGVHRIAAVAYGSPQNGGAGPGAAEVVSRTHVQTAVVWGVKIESVGPLYGDAAFVEVRVTWHELPSYLEEEAKSPLDRADVWPDGKRNDGTEAYTLVVVVEDAAVGGSGELARAVVGHSDGSAYNRTVKVPLPRTGVPASECVVWAQMIPGPPPLDIDERFEEYEQFSMDWMEFEREMQVPERVRHRWMPFVYSATNDSFLMEAGIDGAQAYVTADSNNYGAYGSLGWSYRMDYEVPLRDGLEASFLFREENGHACNVSIQLVDENGNKKLFWMLVEQSSWVEVRARLSEFVIDESGPSLNSSAIAYNNQTSRIVLNVQMLERHDQYRCRFQHLRVTGLNPPPQHRVPDTFPAVVGIHRPALLLPRRGFAPSLEYLSPIFSPTESYSLNFPLAANIGILLALVVLLLATILVTIIWQSTKKARQYPMYRGIDRA